ncbi:MAG: N-acetylated-alpha-linked acidic dipeptidase [Planctomycetota bacterium]|jgi:N-acetylated-alpha-linked acidic dipeptidase
MRRLSLICFAALFVRLAFSQEPAQAPPSRALLQELCASTRLAGTPTSRRGAEFVAGVLEEAGFRVEWDERQVLLSLPRLLEWSSYTDASADVPSLEWVRRFDPDAHPGEDLPLFNAWSASADVRGAVVDVGRGLREDFDRLVREGIKLEGTIALCQYGGAYRGIKAALAEEFGCAGMLLYTSAASGGSGRGSVWPAGPWTPGHDGQRGSIAPMSLFPGDPSTPGFASPAPDEKLAPGQKRLEGEALAASLPQIPCLPIGSDHAEQLLSGLRARRMTGADGKRKSHKLGPGPTEVRLAVDAPREVRTIVNVIGWLDGGPGTVMAGNHRDAWVRGAHDAGGGTVALLRAAQHLGERARTGWKPARSIGLAFWDAEESGLIGSTEWGEANAAALVRDLSLYVNADTAVSGPNFGISGTPGLSKLVVRALRATPLPEGGTLAELALDDQGGIPAMGLPGAGSDYTVFLHHLTTPILDLGFRGNSGGQYHTAFDDFAIVDRFIDPGFVGHERCGRFLAELLVLAGEAGRSAYDDCAAAEALVGHADASRDALGDKAADALAKSLRELTEAARGANNRLQSCPPTLLRALRHPTGLPGRPWFKGRLWAPGIEKGYGADTFPEMRAAKLAGDQAAFDAALEAMLSAIDELAAAWVRVPRLEDQGR